MRIIRAGVVDSVVIFPTGILYRCPKYHGITKHYSFTKISTGICTYVTTQCVSECAYDWSKKAPWHISQLSLHRALAI